MKLIETPPALLVNQYLIWPIKAKALFVKASQLKKEFFSRKRQLEVNQRESESEFEDIESDLLEVLENGRDLAENKEIMEIEWKFLEDESFWRGIHRKHVMEDLTDLKKRQKKGFVECLDMLQDALLEAQEEDAQQQQCRTPVNTRWQKVKRFLSDLLHRSSSKRRLRRQARLDEVFEGLMDNLDIAKDEVDQLFVKQFATYEKKRSPFRAYNF